MALVRKGFAAVALLCMVGATGCGKFFPPLNGGTGGGVVNTGNYVYVANSYTGTGSGSDSAYTVTGFSIGTGTLTAITGATETLQIAPQAIAVTPANDFLYVAASGVLYGYSIASNGALTQILNASNGLVLANANIVSMTVSPDGQWLLALDSNPNAVVIDEFQLGSNGLPTLAQGATYTLKSQMPIVASQIAVSPLGDYISASLGTGGLVLYSFVTSTGVVSPVYEQYAPTASSGDQAAVFDATSSTVYVAVSGTSEGVYPLTIGNGGVLTQASNAPVSLGTGSQTAGAASILIDKSGKYLYVGNRANSSISGFTLGPGGALTALTGSPYAAGTNVGALGRDNSGSYLLSVASGGNPDLKMYTFDSTTPGRLDASATATTGSTQPAGTVALALTH